MQEEGRPAPAGRETRRVWITWEWQRRSIELARNLGCELHVMELEGLKRYPLSIWRTLRALRVPPALLMVQNPSMILATLACIWGGLRRVPVVVDRHTTFLTGRHFPNTPGILLFRLLHRFTLRRADLTIVTNEFLASLVEAAGGRSFVLPDPLPVLPEGTPPPLELPPGKSVLLISSFGQDEPLAQVLEAASSLEKEGVRFFVTGNDRKLATEIRAQAPANVVFTGFLSEADFVAMVRHADVVMALTITESCMLCGCYEAVSAGRPLITSGTEVLRAYFREAVFTENTPEAIAAAVRDVLSDPAPCRERMEAMGKRLRAEWAERAARLESRLEELEKGRNHSRRIS